MVAPRAAPASAGQVERFLALPVGAGTLQAFVATSRTASSSRLEALAEFERAMLRHTRIHPAQALAAVEKALAEGRRGRTAFERAVLRRLYAHTLRATGRVVDALSHYAYAARAFRAAGQPVEAGRTAIGWIDALAHAGRVDEALNVARIARRSLPVSERALRARLEANLGNALYLSGRIAVAARHFQSARRRLQAMGLARDAALCGFNLGQAQLLQGDAAGARRSFEAARRIFAAGRFSAQALQARAAIAASDLALGRWAEAMAELDAVAAKLQAVGHDRAVAAVRREVAEFLSALGAAGAAEPLAAQALQSFRRMGMALDAAQVSFLHARLLAAQGRVGDARARLKWARRQFVTAGDVASEFKCDVELCALALRRGDAEAALSQLRAARARLSRKGAGRGVARALAVEADVQLARGDARRAAATAARAYALASGPLDRLERPWVALLAARAHDQAGGAKPALRWARRSTADAERVARRLGTRALRDQFGDARARLYREAVGIVLRRGGAGAPRLALDLLARARSARLLEDLLAGVEPIADAKLRVAIARLRDKLLAPGLPSPRDVRFHALQREAAALEARLRVPDGEGKANGARFAGALRRWAPRFAGQSVVVYELLDGQWGAFVLAPSGRVRWVPLPGAAAALEERWTSLCLVLEAAAQAPRARRRQLLAETRAEAYDDLRALAAALWEPLEVRASRVVVVPTGALHGVPIEGLAELVPPTAGGTAAAVQVVSRLPHPGVAPVARRTRSRDALLLRGPGTGASREITAVRGVLRSQRYHVRLDDRRAALLRRPDPLALLHVAAHGVFHRDHWLLTGIRLRDGWLGFEALRRRWVRGSLLTFGSCESGLRVEAPHGELDGWLAAGLGAGARELVLTLWKLDDQAAGAFAEAFYPLWTRGIPAPQAAAMARADLRGRLEHPYSWAPFIAVG